MPLAGIAGRSGRNIRVLGRGDRIGKHEIVAPLSIGGMAELFLACAMGPGGFRKFAVIKRILPAALGNESYVHMFLDEARVTAALSHPNIAEVYELGEFENWPYLVMEFIPGQNLNQVTSACIHHRRGMPLGFSVSVARDVCRALNRAHSLRDARGRPTPVIHRDVAQKNVMVTYDGRVKLFDFGIAKSQGALGRTAVGMVKGTTGYMSPEQVRGEDLDGRSDLFAVGVMLHELLTGRRLFSANTEVEEMEKIVGAEIPRPDVLNPVVPAALSEVVMRALTRDRGNRYASGDELAQALEEAGGKLLFDQARMATFMCELFTPKVDATHVVLDSAGKPETEEVRAAIRVITEEQVSTPDSASTTAPRPGGSSTEAARIEAPLPQSAPEGAKTDAVPRLSSGWVILLGALLGLLALGGLSLATRLLAGAGGAAPPTLEQPADPGATRP